MTYSIIIPVYNDPNFPACLESLAHLTGNLQHEVIVVENSQTDWVKPLVERYGFKYLYEPITGSYQARNTGIRASTGDVLVFTDSDCEVMPNWLERIDQQLSQTDVAGVMGFSAGAPATRVAALEQIMYEANIGAFTATERLKRVDTRNLAIKRAVTQRIGIFAETLKYGGDMEFGARAHAAGFRIIYDAEMIVVHHNIKQFKGLLLKRVRQNYGNMMITQLHDREFITAYFPHLLRYQASTKTQLRFYLYLLLLQPQQWFGDLMLRFLPISLGYRYFKAVNVLAMRVGQMAFVLGATIW